MFGAEADKTIVLADSNTERLLEKLGLENLPRIVVAAGEQSKSLESLSLIWQRLMEFGATRKSLLVNVGGGMITDLGGFAASTYKRGIDFVNIPTTLLAMTDASIGGKVGIDFGGMKNQVGAFAEARDVIINVGLLESLDFKNRLSGFAEMLKHGFLDGESLLRKTYAFDLDKFDLRELEELIGESRRVKMNVVEKDLRESGLRKVLNFGHTAGHAFEELGEGLLHGYCVAWGMVVAAYLSVVLTGFPKEELTMLRHYVRENYGELPFDCSHYDRLYELMKGDKKNWGDRINFTLLKAVGEAVTDVKVEKELIFEAIDFLR